MLPVRKIRLGQRRKIGTTLLAFRFVRPSRYCPPQGCCLVTFSPSCKELQIGRKRL
jgi:hypothetical protein